MNLKKLDFNELSEQDLILIDGGRSFWGDLGYVLGYSARALRDISNSLREESSYGNANIYK